MLKDLKQLTPYLWEIPQTARSDMRVPARMYVSKKMLADIFKDESVKQIMNVATMPGIVNYALAMPDIHEGYGFPIGGVAAFDFNRGGVVSPGGVGFDINCGVRLLRSPLSFEEVKLHISDLANQIARDVPSGVGRGGRIILKEKQIDKILEDGVRDLIKNGYASEEDAAHCEEGGSMAGARSDLVSDRAKKRGSDQLGTLGSGNHFLEIQRVEKIFLPEIAEQFGLWENQIVVMIHTGSRGLGHQVCTDYARVLNNKMSEWNIKLPDRELAYAPLDSREGKEYLAAMAAAANFAWSNRQMITHHIRGAWERILKGKFEKLGLTLIYDVAHNIAKIEKHLIGGKRYKLCVHRKGATRAFGPGREEIPSAYQKIGQPVLIPGTMGTASYVLIGTNEAMAESFGSTCHGAGRMMSRHAAKRQVQGGELRKKLEEQGIIVRCPSSSGLAEEAPLAYKDIDDVVEVVENAGLANRVARLRPLAVVKGG